MTKMTTPSLDPRRLFELDSLRGIAAFSVVIGHLRNLCSDDLLSRQPAQKVASLKIALHYLLHPIAASHEAVILFFTLSGLVLALPAVKGRAQTYPVFLVRRIFRIYLPYLAAIAVAILADYYFTTRAARAPWMQNFWSIPVSWHAIRQHILFIGSYNEDQFNPPIWSLIHEMRISLIFPFLCAIALRLKPSRQLVAAAFVTAGVVAARDFLHFFAFTVTIHYIALFLLGIYIARQKDVLGARYGRLSRRARIAFASASLALYLFGGLLWTDFIVPRTSFDTSLCADWFIALGAAGIILVALNSHAISRILHWRPIHMCGEMSYGLYLIHWILVLITIYLCYGRLPWIAIIPICFAVVLTVSWAFYIRVEKPCMDWGRRLSQYFASKKPEPIPATVP